jgi:hypothetical protein
VTSHSLPLLTIGSVPCEARAAKYKLNVRDSPKPVVPISFSSASIAISGVIWRCLRRHGNSATLGNSAVHFVEGVTE